jgi:hypothetical protein
MIGSSGMALRWAASSPQEILDYLSGKQQEASGEFAG